MCTFCADKIKLIDYKDTARLRRYLSDRAKIEPRRKTGTCAKHQRMLTTALKRARHMALLPYTAEQVREMMSPQQRAAVGGPPPERPPRTFEPRFEGPRGEGPRGEAARGEGPRAEGPRAEGPRGEGPREAPRPEPHRSEPRPETSPA
ncbi:MAG TPA: 30S ribosomal protein S18 [Candidatus Dormibacteraeota bacterium]|jgi:small subunit ribosomal protein S18|nr:30S ribosomal protein S18 [Candidatus Dormibacteraeota bacterium]